MCFEFPACFYFSVFKTVSLLTGVPCIRLILNTSLQSSEDGRVSVLRHPVSKMAKLLPNLFNDKQPANSRYLS